MQIGMVQTALTPLNTRYYYIPMTIGGQTIYGIHDTGYTHSIMSYKLAESLGLPVKPYVGIFQVANNSYSSYKGQVTNFKVQVHPQLMQMAPLI